MRKKFIAKLLNCFIVTTENNNLTRGFTLLELIIVIVLIGIMAAIGSNTFSSYSRTAKLNAAANELVTTLSVAKSNALSQVKNPLLCGAADTLNGYKVVTKSDCKTYDLNVVCGNTDHKIGNTKTLPDNIVFTSTAQKSFFFPVLKGGATGDATVGVSGFGKAECIGVSSTGIIAVHQQPCPPTGCIPPPPPPKTCTLVTSTWRSGLDAACAAYCGAFTPTVTCGIQVSVASETHAKTYDYVTCTSSLSQTKSGSVCLPPLTTTCTCS